MDTIKLNFHSMVDVITNSSTTIFTYQDGIKEAKELLQEVFDLSGETRKVDELFYFDVFLDEIDRYTEFIDENEDEYDIYDYLEKKLDSLGNLISKVAFGAYFYDFLKKRNKKYGISLYEPEIMSKYLDLKDGKVYASSFI